MQSKPISIFACLLIVCSGCDTFEANPTYIFSGQVIDAQTGVPIDSARIFIARYSSGEACELASGKPCGEGFKQITATTVNAEGEFYFKYDISVLLSSRHQITVAPCIKETSKCKYEGVVIRTDGSWINQKVRLQMK